MATVLKTISTVTHDTTVNWNKYPRFVPKAGEIIVYDDRKTIIDANGNTKKVPGIKIGDGNAYLIDLPFTNDVSDDMNLEDVMTMLQNHIQDTTVHVTTEEKQKWNNKLNYSVVGEALQFTLQ